MSREEVFFVANITLPIEAVLRNSPHVLLQYCFVVKLQKHFVDQKTSPCFPPVRPEVNTNKKLFYSLSILLLHRLFNISMSPCCHCCPDDGQALMLKKKKKKRKIVLQHWRWLIHGRSLHRAGLFVEKPEAFPSKRDATSHSLEAGLCISSSNLFFFSWIEKLSPKEQQDKQQNRFTSGTAWWCSFHGRTLISIIDSSLFSIIDHKNVWYVCVCDCTTTDFQTAAVDNISSRIMLNTLIKKGGIHYLEKKILGCKVCTWLRDESILAVQSSCVPYSGM